MDDAIPLILGGTRMPSGSRARTGPIGAPLRLALALACWAWMGVAAENASLASPEAFNLLARTCGSVYPLRELAADFQSCQNISVFSNDKADLSRVFHYGACQAVQLHLQLLCRGSSQGLKAQTGVTAEELRSYNSDQVCGELEESVPVIDCERVHLMLGITLAECQKHEKLRQILADHPQVCQSFCAPVSPNGTIAMTPLCRHLYFTSRNLRTELRQFLRKGISSSAAPPVVSVKPALVIPPKMMPLKSAVENDSPLTGEEPVHVIDSRKHPELPQNQSRPETIETSQGQDEKVDSSKMAPNGSQVQEPPVVSASKPTTSTSTTTTEMALKDSPALVEPQENIPAPKPVNLPGPSSKDSSHFAEEKFRSFHEGESQSQAFSYLILFLIMGLVFYLVFHNKKKILALVLEGRQGRQTGGRQRHRGARYHKLDNNLEEAMGSSSSDSMRQIIY